MDDRPRSYKLLALLGLLSGLSFLAHLGVVFSLPATTPLHELQVYNANPDIYAALFLTVVAFAVFAIAFLAGMGGLMVPQNRPLAWAAAFSAVTGILVTALGIILTVGALQALSQVPTDASTASTAAFEGAFWGNLQSITNLAGEPFMGLGLLLFARLAWSGSVLPRWLAIVALVGGIAAFPAIFIDSLAILPLGAITVWGLACGIILWRRSGASA